MPLSPLSNLRIRRTYTIHCILIILIISITACAETGGTYPDAAFFSKGITIIDIRTELEWQSTGIIKGSKTITFFDENGEYDLAKFRQQLDQIIDPDEEFAIICRSGHRTRVAAQFLTQEGYKVIDIQGGVQYLPKIGIKLVQYPDK